jgi:transcriptional regulatory protein LevR
VLHAHHSSLDSLLTCITCSTGEDVSQQLRAALQATSERDQQLQVCPYLPHSAEHTFTSGKHKYDISIALVADCPR